MGPDHPNVARDLNNLASLLHAMKRLGEAEPLMRRVVQILLTFSRQGFEHLHLQAGLNNYETLLQAMGLSQEEIQTKLNNLQQPT